MIEGKEIPFNTAIGDKMLMPLPVRWTDANLPYTDTYLEVIRGERLTLHIEENHAMLRISNGDEVDEDLEYSQQTHSPMVSMSLKE